METLNPVPSSGILFYVSKCRPLSLVLVYLSAFCSFPFEYSKLQALSLVHKVSTASSHGTRWRQPWYVDDWLPTASLTHNSTKLLH